MVYDKNEFQNKTSLNNQYQIIWLLNNLSLKTNFEKIEINIYNFYIEKKTY